MWSDRYFYLNIFDNLELSVHCDTRELIKFLRTLPELKQTDHFTFCNSSRLPVFLDVSLLYASSLNSWSEKDTDQYKTNLIAAVCGKSGTQSFRIIETLLIKIASFLNWQLVDEQTDEGIENYVIWAP